jgi:hypothetical protein
MTALDEYTTCQLVKEHRFDYNDERGRWVCIDCGKVAASTDSFIAPCASCGIAVDANEVYCATCLGVEKT